MLWSLRPCQLYNFSQIFRCLFIFMLTSGQLDLTGLLRVKYTSSGECKNQGTKLNISKWNFTDLTLLYTLILGCQIKYLIYSNDQINWYEIMWRSPLLSILSLKLWKSSTDFRLNQRFSFVWKLWSRKGKEFSITNWQFLGW